MTTPADKNKALERNGENQDSIAREDEKIGDTTKPDGSSAMSENEESSFKTATSRCESINDISDVVEGSNVDRSGDGVGVRPESPVISDPSKSDDGDEVDKDESHQTTRDSGEAHDGRENLDANEMDAPKQTLNETGEEDKVSQDSKSNTRMSDSSSTGGVDLETSSKEEEKTRSQQKSTKEDDETKSDGSQVIAMKEKDELDSNDSVNDSGCQNTSSRDVEDSENTPNQDEEKEENTENNHIIDDGGNNVGTDVRTDSAKTSESDITSSEKLDLDLPSNIMHQTTEKILLKPDQESVDSKVSLENQEDQEKTDLLETMGDQADAKTKLPDEESAEQAVLISERVSTIRPTEPVQADIDSMKEEPNDTVDIEVLISPAPEPKVENSLGDDNRGEDAPNIPQLKEVNIDNRSDESESEPPTGQSNMTNNNEVEIKNSFNPSKLIIQTSKTDSEGEQKSMASSVDNDHQSQQESCKRRDENDSISNTQISPIDHGPKSNDILQDPLRLSLNDEVAGFLSEDPDKLLSTDNDVQLEDLEDLLLYNPSSAKPPATLPVNENSKPDLECLEDIPLNSASSRMQSNATVGDQSQDKKSEMQVGKEQNPELKHSEDKSKPPATLLVNENSKPDLECLEDLLLNSASSRMQSNATFGDKSQDENSEVQVGKEQNPELKHSEDTFLDSTPSGVQSNLALKNQIVDENRKIQSDLDHASELKHLEDLLVGSPFPPRPSDHVASMNDSTPISADRYGSTKPFETPTSKVNKSKEEYDETAQMSVFSDATSGQDFLRNVSNAKKKLKEIEDEMKELGGLTHTSESRIVDNVNSNMNDDKGVILPSETNGSMKGNRSQISTENKSKKQSERGREPPTLNGQEILEQPSDGRKRKPKHKSVKKKQVRPEKGKQKGPIDPNGKEVPRMYNDRERKRRTSSSSSSRQMAREKSSGHNNVNNTEQNCNQKDPPMVVGGVLEEEGSPSSWNDDQKKKSKKKRSKRHKNQKQREPLEGVQEDTEMKMNSVTSSRMERGDGDVNPDNWMLEGSFAEEEDSEIDGVPRHVETKESGNNQPQYDPWEEIPCSWCCRYLPHTLVVATTQAYRLDQADEKSNELMESKIQKSHF